MTLGSFALLVGGHGVRHYLTTEPTHRWHAMRLRQNLIWDLRDVGIGIALVLSGALLWKGHKWPQLFTLAGVSLLWVVAAILGR